MRRPWIARSSRSGWQITIYWNSSSSSSSSSSR